MKKNILIIAAVVAGIMLISWNDSRAQQTPPPAGPPTISHGPPGGMRPIPPGFRGRAGARYMQTIMFLKMSKAELQHATEDFDGHRQTAMDACDKAIAELEAVQSIVQSEAAAKAAAARAAQSNQAPATPAAPAAPATPSQ